MGKQTFGFSVIYYKNHGEFMISSTISLSDQRVLVENVFQNQASEIRNEANKLLKQRVRGYKTVMMNMEDKASKDQDLHLDDDWSEASTTYLRARKAHADLICDNFWKIHPEYYI